MEEMRTKIAKLEKREKDWEKEKKIIKGKKNEVGNKEVRRLFGTVDESRARSQLYATSYHTEYTGVQDKFNQSSKSSQSSQSSHESRHESQSRRGPQAKRGRSGNVRLTPAGSAKNNYVGVQGPYGNPNHKSSSSYKNSAKKSYGPAEQSKGPENLQKIPKNPLTANRLGPPATFPPCQPPSPMTSCHGPHPPTSPPKPTPTPTHSPPTPPPHHPPSKTNTHPESLTPYPPPPPLPQSPIQNLRSNRHPTPQKCRCPKLECPSLWPKSK